MQRSIRRLWLSATSALCSLTFLLSAVPAAAGACDELPGEADLHEAMAAGKAANPTLNVQMWAMVVANDGTVCARALSDDDQTHQPRWLASRGVAPLDADQDPVDLKALGSDNGNEGLVLYNDDGNRLGSIIVISSDIACADLSILEQTRHNLGLDFATVHGRC